MYAPVSLILSIGLLASNVAAARDRSGKCRVQIKQSATNWIDSVDIFDPGGTTIGNSWSDSRYPNRARGSDGLDIALNGKPHRLVIKGATEEQGEKWNWNVGVSYAEYMAEDCSHGAWDPDVLEGRVELSSVYRDIKCYFTC